MLGFFNKVEDALHLGHKDPDSEPKEEDDEKDQQTESNEPKEEDGEQEPEKAEKDGPAEQLMDFMQNFKKTKIKKTKKGRVLGRKGLASGLLKLGKEYANEEKEEEEGNENDEEDCEDDDCVEEEEVEETAPVVGN